MAPPKPRQKSETENSPNRWLRWGPMVIAVAPWAYFILSDYFELRIDKKIDNKLEVISEKSETKLQPISEKLSALGERVAKLEGKLDGLRIQKLAMEPKKAVNAKRVTEILDAAKKSGTRLDSELITDAGKQFVSAGGSTNSPDVWNAALTFLNYRSFLNDALAPATDRFTSVGKTPLPWKFKFNDRAHSRDYEYHIRTGEEVPSERAAVLEPIGEPLNISEEIGFAFLLIADHPMGFILDGSRLRNIIFKNSKIVYDGGPVEMENVYFVNCTFEVSRRPSGKTFAETVLAAEPATTFHAGG